MIDIDAFRKAGQQTTYRDKILVTTLAPCWYCSGLIRQFNIGRVVIGESINFEDHKDWLINPSFWQGDASIHAGMTVFLAIWSL